MLRLTVINSQNNGVNQVINNLLCLTVISGNGDGIYQGSLNVD